MPKRRSYDDKFRASAVVMLEAAGYPNSKGALERTARHLGVPPPTLHRWATGKNNPPPSDIVTIKRGEIKDLLRDEIYAIAGEMATKRTDASYRDLATALGITIDKLQLLSGEPTQNANQRIIIEYVDTEIDPAASAF